MNRIFDMQRRFQAREELPAAITAPCGAKRLRTQVADPRENSLPHFLRRSLTPCTGERVYLLSNGFTIIVIRPCKCVTISFSWNSLAVAEMTPSDA